MNATPNTAFEVKVTRDINYGHSGINYGDASKEPQSRAMHMDAYHPEDGASCTLRPAIVLAFGGAFHTGSKERDFHEEWVDGVHHCTTPIAEYCHWLASLGYVCFSVDYRKMSEDPDPGTTPVLQDRGAMSRSAIDRVRSREGLPVLTDEQVADGFEAAADDLDMAIRYVHDNATQFGIDPQRIAAGGFSAGGTSALYAVFGHGAPAKAVLTISGRLEEPDIDHYVGKDVNIAPSILQVVGSDDFDYVVHLNGIMAEKFKQTGMDASVAEVIGGRHFFQRTAPLAGRDGRTVSDAVQAFFDSKL